MKKKEDLQTVILPLEDFLCSKRPLGPLNLAPTDALIVLISAGKPLFEIFTQSIDSFYDYSNGILRTSWGHLDAPAAIAAIPAIAGIAAIADNVFYTSIYLSWWDEF